eukprot:7172223-Heterocapsa_arctica.AAC.1
MAERAQAAALASVSPLEDGTLRLTYAAAHGAHAAYDAPKKFPAQAVLEFGKTLLKDGGVAAQAVRASKVIGKQLATRVPL